MEIIVYCLYFYITGFIAVFLLALLRNKIGLLYDYKDCKIQYKEWFIDYDNTRELYTIKETILTSLLSWVGFILIIVLLSKEILMNSKYTYKFKNWFENKGE